MNTNELKPCPFCGVIPVETGTGFAAHHKTDCFMGIKGSDYFNHGQVQSWNSRADLVPAVDLGMVLEALRDLRSAAMSSSYPHEAIKQAEQAISHLEAVGVK